MNDVKGTNLTLLPITSPFCLAPEYSHQLGKISLTKPKKEMIYWNLQNRLRIFR